MVGEAMTELTSSGNMPMTIGELANAIAELAVSLQVSHSDSFWTVMLGGSPKYFGRFSGPDLGPLLAYAIDKARRALSGA